MIDIKMKIFEVAAILCNIERYDQAGIVTYSIVLYSSKKGRVGARKSCGSLIVDEKMSCHLPIFTDNMTHIKTTVALHSLIRAPIQVMTIS